MLLGELIQGLDIRPTGAGSEAVRICDLTEDSRTVLPGSLFIARPGTKSDGRQFIDQAINAGAAAILTTRDAAQPANAGGVAWLTTTILALAEAQLAERFFANPSSRLTLIGATGTNGKTTVTHLIQQLLNNADRRCGLIGTTTIDDGGRKSKASLTTPPAIELSYTLAKMLDNGCVAASMEVSSHSLDQHRVAALSFDIALFTNLTGDHLDYHATMERYAAAKAGFFASLKPDGVAIVNADDPVHALMLADCRARVLRCTVNGLSNSECSASAGRMTFAGMPITLRGPWGTIEGHTRLIGAFNVMNILQAVAAAYSAGIERDDIALALYDLQPPPGRLEPVSTPPPLGRGSGASRGGGTLHAPDLELLPLHPDDHHKRNPITVGRAQELRSAMTFPERLLWSRLKGDQIEGHRFRRQHPIGPFIADFYCAEVALVVEVDGRTHRTPEAKQSDESRDRWMREHGLEIERVTNDQVLQSLNAVVEQIRRAVLVRTSRTNVPSVPPPGPLPRGGGVKPVLSVLVPNDKGFDRALAIHRSGLPLKIAVFTAASETFSKKNTNATIAESIERFRAFIPRAASEGIAIRAYVSCAIACPLEGPIKPAAVRAVVDRLFTLFDTDESRAALDIDLGDTIGVAHPHEIEALLGEFDEDLRENQVTLHLHDTFGRAGSCVKTALGLGVRSFDGSVAGLGGCPYASTPERRAPGNIATETLVRTIHASGFAAGVDLDRLTEAANFARSLALTPPPSGRGSGVSRGGGTPGTPDRQ